MAYGDGAQLGYTSLLGISEETTFGTHVTASAFIEFNSESMAMNREEIKLEAINTSRNFKRRMYGNQSVEGTLEMDLNISSDPVVYLLKQAMGGTATADTVSSASSGAMKHTIAEGDMESNKSSGGAATVKSLGITVRKGGVVTVAGTITASIFQYNGCRVNTLTISGEIGSPIKLSAGIVGQGGTASSDSLTASFTNTAPLHFDGVTFSSGDSIGNLSAESIISFEMTLNNNIISDAAARKLGSDKVQVLPPTRREISLAVTQRWDTTGNFSRFNSGSQNFAGTQMAFQILLSSNQTIASVLANSTISMHINLPNCRLNGPAVPEVGDVGVLTTDLEYSCLEDSATAYAIQMQVNNGTQTY